MNVSTTIAANNLCLGCGICASLCPASVLNIQSSEFGENVVYQQKDSCQHSCSLCLQVCPSADGKYDEDNLGAQSFENIKEIKHQRETGYYLGTSFAGYSAMHSHRTQGASGGITTWVLEQLLTREMVDAVCCVSSTTGSENHFEYVVCHTPEEVRCCSSSAYYPVELSSIIKHILEHDERYAIVGLPCICKALRLAMKIIPALRARVKYILGLTCGQTKSRFFGECLAAKDGGNPHHLNTIQYRIKSKQRSAQDFGMKYVCAENGKEEKSGTVFWQDGMGSIWNNRHFTINACNFCDDVFSELADACFMDAWLPQYSADYRGHTIVLFRNPTLRLLVEQGTSVAEIHGDWLSIQQVILSQPSAINSKRSEIKERIQLARKKGLAIPQKRDHLFEDVHGVGRKLRIRVQYDISQYSRRLWVNLNKDWDLYQRATRKYSIALKYIRYLERAESALKKAGRLMRRLLHGK